MENKENLSALVDIGSTAANVSTEQSQQPPAKEYVRKGPDKTGFFWGTGRRKSSVARVRIKPGDGKMLVNKKELGEYFSRPEHKNAAVAPLKAVDGEGKFDVFVNVSGGGITGQAGAIMLGLARALRDYDPILIEQLRQTGYLTRDGRMSERKKPGQKGARKKFQFSKR